MGARVVMYQVEPGMLDAALRHTREVTRPVARRRPGWRSVSIMVDRATGTVRVVSLWDSVEQARAADDDANFVAALPHGQYATGPVTIEYFEVADHE
jgi:hypothetical protein